MDESVRRAVWKTLIIGALATVAATLLAGPAFGYAVMVGAGLSATNLAALGWLGRRQLDKAQETEADKQRLGAIMGLMMLKMFLLLAVAFFAMAVLGVHPIGFAIGYSVFIAAACWEAFSSRPAASQ